jgi:hypothetical protein
VENKDKHMNRYLKGTSFPMTNIYESCADAASPSKAVPPMSIGMLVATALMMQPIIERTVPEIKK